MLIGVLASSELWLHGPESLKNENELQVNELDRLSE